MSVSEHKEKVIGMMIRRVHMPDTARMAVEQLIAAVHAEYRDKVTELIDEYPVSPATRVALSRLYGGNHAFELAPPAPPVEEEPGPEPNAALSAVLGELVREMNEMRNPMSTSDLYHMFRDVKRKLDDGTLGQSKMEFDA